MFFAIALLVFFDIINNMKDIGMTKQEALDYLKKKGFSPDEVIRMKSHMNNKELAKELHSSPVRIQGLLEAIGYVPLSNKEALQVSLRNTISNRRKELVSQWDKDSLQKIVSDKLSREVKNELVSLGVKYLLDYYNIELDNYHTVQMHRRDKKFYEEKSSEIKKYIKSGIPVKRIASIVCGDNFSIKSFYRFFNEEYPDYKSDPALVTIESLNERYKNDLSYIKYIKNQTIPDALISSITSAPINLIKRKYNDLSIINSSKSSLWDWIIQHKSEILHIFHIPHTCKLYVDISQRIDNKLNDKEFIKKIKYDGDSLSIIDFSNYSDIFAAAWCFIYFGYGMKTSDRVSLSKYIDHVSNINGNITNKNINSILNKWFDDFSKLQTTTEEKNNFNAYKKWMAEKDSSLKETIIKTCHFHSINDLFNEIPFFRRNSMYFTCRPDDDSLLLMRRNNKSLFVEDIPQILDIVKDYTVNGTIKNTQLVTICKEYGVSYKSLSDKIKNTITTIEKKESIFETKFEIIAKSLNLEYKKNCRDILPSRKELDFYFPDRKIAFEISPTMTHNSTVGWGMDKSLAKPENYHKNKTKEAEENGITLITLYSRDLVSPIWENITIPFIKYKLLGADYIFYGRNVNIQIISAKNAKEFLESTHEQGFKPANIHVGFFSNKGNQLLGVASIKSKSTNIIELERLSFLPDVQIRFSISKLISWIANNISLFTDNDEILLRSFSRNDMGSGNGYKQAGFTLVKETPPTLKYVNMSYPLDSYSWQAGTTWSAKNGIIARANNASMNLTKAEAIEWMENEMPHRNDSGKGYVRVYDSGNKLWEIKIKKKK